MADSQITLSIVKTDDMLGIKPQVITYGKPELHKTIDVTVVDTDGKPYDLTDKDIIFTEKFSDDGFGTIIDNGSGDHSGKFIRDDDKSGKFKYELNQYVFLGNGDVQFEFKKGDEVQDATEIFSIEIQTKLDLGYKVNSQSYISDFDSLLDHFKFVISQTSTKVDGIVQDLQAKIQKAITDGQTDISNEVTDSKKKIDDLISKTQTLIDTQTQSITDNSKKLSDLTTSWQTVSKQIQDKADAEMTKVQSDFDTEISQIKANAQKELDGLKTSFADTLAAKANQSDLDSLTQKVSAKANQSDLDAVNTALKSKADKTDLADYAKTADVNSSLALKADKTSLDDYDKTTDVDTKLQSKASADDIKTIKDEITALQGIVDEQKQKIAFLEARKPVVTVKSMADISKYPDQVVVVDDGLDDSSSGGTSSTTTSTN